MNKTFLELVAQKSERDPRMMMEPDWPLVLARHAADILAIAPVSDESPAPVLAPLATPTPRENPLERGAYNKARSRSRYYYNGGWYYY